LQTLNFKVSKFAVASSARHISVTRDSFWREISSHFVILAFFSENCPWPVSNVYRHIEEMKHRLAWLPSFQQLLILPTQFLVASVAPVNRYPPISIKIFIWWGKKKTVKHFTVSKTGFFYMNNLSLHFSCMSILLEVFICTLKIVCESPSKIFGLDFQEFYWQHRVTFKSENLITLISKPSSIHFLPHTIWTYSLFISF